MNDYHIDTVGTPLTRNDHGPFFVNNPGKAREWTKTPTRNARGAALYFANKDNFKRKQIGKVHKQPWKLRVLHWFMTKVLGWKFTPASQMQGSPVFQAVLRDVDRAQGQWR